MVDFLETIITVGFLGGLVWLIVFWEKTFLQLAVSLPLMGIASVALGLSLGINRSQLENSDPGFWVSEFSHVLYGIFWVLVGLFFLAGGSFYIYLLFVTKGSDEPKGVIFGFSLKESMNRYKQWGIGLLTLGLIMALGGLFFVFAVQPERPPWFLVFPFLGYPIALVGGSLLSAGIRKDRGY